MALKDWVRNDGFINTIPSSSPIYRSDEEFIMLVRDIQYRDIQFGNYNRFPTLYDVALSNKGRTYIQITDNTKLVQDPPNLNSFKRT